MASLSNNGTISNTNSQVNLIKSHTVSNKEIWVEAQISRSVYYYHKNLTITPFEIDGVKTIPNYPMICVNNFCKGSCGFIFKNSKSTNKNFSEVELKEQIPDVICKPNGNSLIRVHYHTVEHNLTDDFLHKRKNKQLTQNKITFNSNEIKYTFQNDLKHRVITNLKNQTLHKNINQQIISINSKENQISMNFINKLNTKENKNQIQKFNKINNKNKNKNKKQINKNKQI
jgi:hypothetical protein